MSVQGIGPAGIPQWPAKPGATPQESEGAGQARERTPAAPARSAAVTPPVAPATDAALEASGSVPDGVDGELWSLLTTEERAHFARFAAMGGVTYGPRAEGPSRPPVRGQRLDLRI